MPFHRKKNPPEKPPTTPAKVDIPTPGPRSGNVNTQRLLDEQERRRKGKFK